MTNAVERLSVVRWRKYGKDRLYVNAPDGQRIGWVDLISGLATLEVAAHADALAEAVSAFCSAHELPVPDLDSSAQITTPDVAESLSPSAPPIDSATGVASVDPLDAATTEGEVLPAAAEVPDWQDLVDNRPGQGVRAMAAAELAAMRERSKIGAFLARAMDAKTQERSWRVGADGEEAVGARLDKLTRHGWHVLHSVPVGKGNSDIDHILIGPGGVYTINTKRHPNKSIWVGRSGVRVDGRRQPYLRNSRYEADRAAKLLSQACGFPVIVKPALVFLTATLFPDVTVKERPADVIILDRMDLPGAFRRAKGRLTADQVETIFDQARRSTTWTN